MICINEAEFYLNEINRNYTILIPGKFSNIDKQEFLNLTYNPQNILIANGIKIPYINYYYRVSLCQKIKIKVWQFFTKTKTLHYTLTFASGMYVNAYTQEFPKFEGDMSGEFMLELTVDCETYKTFIFNRLISEYINGDD